VSTHLKHAFTKLGVTSRLELARIALTRAQSNVVP
jgi:DNA-binding CsgD family transcriptional regulator